MSTHYYFHQHEMQEQRELLDAFLFDLKTQLRTSADWFVQQHLGEGCADTVLEHKDSLVASLDYEFVGCLDTEEEFLLVCNDGSLYSPVNIPFSSDLLSAAWQLEERCANGALIIDEYGHSWSNPVAFVKEVLLPHTDPEQRELYLAHHA